MRILVTGATGYIGFAVAEAMARAGHHAHGLVRSKEKAARVAAAEIQPVLGSMEDPESFLPAARSCQVIIHCAVDSSPHRLEMDRELIKTLIADAHKSGTPRLLIYTSGVWVYGDTGDGVVDEASPTNPVEHVAARVLTEKMLLDANRDNLRTLLIRPGCVYGGPGGMTGDWFESALKKGSALIVGDGSFRWSWIHLHDLAHLYVRAAESSWGGEIFNATDRSRFTIRECAQAASMAAGAGGKVTTVALEEAAKTMGTFAPCLVLNQHVDSSKAVRMLNWQPRHGGFVDGITRYFISWKAAHGQ